MKCIVCGSEIDSNGENKSLCQKCREWGYIDDVPEECREKCQNIWSFPYCIWECATIPDEEKYVIMARL